MRSFHRLILSHWLQFDDVEHKNSFLLLLSELRNRIDHHQRTSLNPEDPLDPVVSVEDVDHDRLSELLVPFLLRHHVHYSGE